MNSVTVKDEVDLLQKAVVFEILEIKLEPEDDMVFKEEPLSSSDEEISFQSKPKLKHKTTTTSGCPFHCGILTAQDHGLTSRDRQPIQEPNYLGESKNLSQNEKIKSQEKSQKINGSLQLKCLSRGRTKGAEQSFSVDNKQSSMYPLVKLHKLEIKNSSEGFVDSHTDFSACFEATPNSAAHSKQTYLKLTKCPHCDYTNKNRGNLRRHINGHSNKRFKCSKCDYRTHRSDHFKRHESLHILKKVKCLFCEFRTNNKTLLQQHKEEHKLKFSQIQYKESYKSDLKFGKIVESGQEMFKCLQCDYRSCYRSKIERHSLSHTNLKLFKCSICHYSSSYMNHIKRHSLRHETKSKKYKCSDCSYSTDTKQLIRNHVQIHFK